MIPKIRSLTCPKLIKAAKSLATKGYTAVSNNNLFYLNIDDAYIHQLYPFLEIQNLQKPAYFGEKSAGAHITIIYPEENKKIRHEDLQKEHTFIIKEVVAAEILAKTYYVLLIESESLRSLRQKYQLPDLLCFKGYAIQFHITLGVKI